MTCYASLKGTNFSKNPLLKFVSDLERCVIMAIQNLATDLSANADNVYGTSQRIAKTDITPARAAAAAIPQAMGIQGHLDVMARRFLQTDTSRLQSAYHGNSVEQVAADYMAASGIWEPGVHYLYQSSSPEPGFPVDYRGGSRGTGRPDFRFALGGGEAVVDITTMGYEKHVLLKKTKTGTINDTAAITDAVEIYWDRLDFYKRGQ